MTGDVPEGITQPIGQPAPAPASDRSASADFWRPRVEGQIKHTIGRHPEWFNLPTATAKRSCIRSIAKRIIGEIVAASKSGDGTDRHDDTCGGWSNGVDASVVSHRRGRRPETVAAPLELSWYDATTSCPEQGGQMPYLVVYEAGSGTRRVTEAVWAGPDRGWVFLAPRFRSGLSRNVTYWAKYPSPPAKKREAA